MRDIRELTQLLSAVEPVAREALISEAQTLAFPPDTVIYAQGDFVDGVSIVMDGLVKETARAEGQLLLVRLTSAGEMLGTGEFFSEPFQTMSATTLRQTRLCWFAQTSLQEIFQQHPEVLLWLMENFSRHLGGLRSAIVETAYLESAARLTRKLLHVAERFGERTAQGLVIDLNLSRDEWAALAGMAPETVSQILHGLERRGWIALEGRHIRLIQAERLGATAL